MILQSIAEARFRGAVLITRGEEVLFEHASGSRDLANDVPNDADTRFATASAGKVFVAVGILRLIDEGRLRFEDTIGKLLSVEWRAIDPEITVEELLTHTSGIPDYFDESVMIEYEELWQDFPNYRIRSNRDLLPLFIDKPMAFPRGERFAYNNAGFVVLAMIIEEVTGERFDEYLEKSVFRPSGMRNTGYYELDRLPARCAMNYIYDEEHNEYRTNIFSVDAKGTGAGGAFTTIHDVRRFWETLFAGKLVRVEMLDRMLSRHAGDEEGSYGYGIWLAQTGDSFDPFFQGADPGVSFISYYCRASRMIVVLVSNFGDNVWNLLGSILSDSEFS